MLHYTSFIGCLVFWLSLAGMGPLLSAAERVYFHDFQKAPGPEWQNAPLSDRARQQKVLGDYANDTIEFAQAKLPPHQYLRIKFDLHIIGLWQGAETGQAPGAAGVLPAIWSCRLGEGPYLIQASFASAEDSLQSYPDLDLRLVSPLKFGPTSRSLFSNRRDRWNNPFISDGIILHKIQLLIPHTAENLNLKFNGQNLTGILETAWALDNFNVDALSLEEVPPLTPAQLRDCWQVLGEAPPEKAATAAWQLVAQPDQAVSLAREKIPEFITVDPQTARQREMAKQLITQLDSDSFADRQEAWHRLQELGPALSSVVQQAWQRAESAEAKEKLRLLLQTWASQSGPQFSRQDYLRLRLARILELINSSESLELAGKLRE
ncbi:MAG: hypothetical protein SFX18_10590 [Pirellulales bacterium]|nr:hypothetical protein [Pirellulales bacterium]